jgi:hypothetical protein
MVLSAQTLFTISCTLLSKDVCARAKSPQVRPARPMGRHPSGQVLAQLRPPPSRSSQPPPAASTSCRAVAGAAVPPAAARLRGAAELPDNALPPAAIATGVVAVVVELEPGARSRSRRSIETDDSDQSTTSSSTRR